MYDAIGVSKKVDHLPRLTLFHARRPEEQLLLDDNGFRRGTVRSAAAYIRDPPANESCMSVVFEASLERKQPATKNSVRENPRNLTNESPLGSLLKFTRNARSGVSGFRE